MREIIFFIFKKSQNKPMFWIFIVLYTFFSWKILRFLQSLDSTTWFLFGFLLSVGMAPAWGYYIGNYGRKISEEKVRFKNDLRILMSDLTTRLQKDSAGMRILKSPECSQKSVEHILLFTEANTEVNDLALEKLREFNTLIKKP